MQATGPERKGHGETHQDVFDSIDGINSSPTPSPSAPPFPSLYHPGETTTPFSPVPMQLLVAIKKPHPANQSCFKVSDDYLHVGLERCPLIIFPQSARSPVLLDDDFIFAPLASGSQYFRHHSHVQPRTYYFPK